MKKTSELIWQDKQHQILLELIDQIDDNIVNDSVFRRLHDYAENHFMLEEEYMRQLNYPAIGEHIAAHNKFRFELNNMLQSFHDYDNGFRQALAEFLRGWLKGHIFGIDKELEDFILKSDVK